MDHREVGWDGSRWHESGCSGVWWGGRLSHDGMGQEIITWRGRHWWGGVDIGMSFQ